jgi:hypothetical protein
MQFKIAYFKANITKGAAIARHCGDQYRAVGARTIKTILCEWRVQVVTTTPKIGPVVCFGKRLNQTVIAPRLWLLR